MRFNYDLLNVQLRTYSRQIKTSSRTRDLENIWSRTATTSTTTTTDKYDECI